MLSRGLGRVWQRSHRAGQEAKRSFSAGGDLGQFVRQYPKTDITVLPNGIRVASEPSRKEGDTASVGVWVETGSRHESEKNNGVAHFLEHMFFKGTKSRDRVQLESEIEAMGGHLNAYTSRAHTAFYAKVFRKDVPKAVEILADVILGSEIKAESIERERDVILREMQEIDGQTEEVVFDRLHQTAYRGCSLGRTILGPVDNIKSFTREDIMDYINTHYTGPRMVIAGAGIEHDKLVQLASKLFGKVPAAPSNGKKVVQEPAVFTGSDMRIRQEDMEQCHVALAFPIAGWNDPDNFPLTVMQSMLGSWDRDASAGHGVNNPSFLVSQVAERKLAASLMTFMTSYNDTGLFGVYATAEKHGQEQLMYHITNEITRLSYEVDEDRLNQAKQQLKTTWLSMLDSNAQVTEDIGRHILQYGRRIHPAESIARIEAVDSAAVKSAARRFFNDRDHALVAIGPNYELPDYNWIRRRSYWLRY